jgi:hypothetical protein
VIDMLPPKSSCSVRLLALTRFVFSFQSHRFLMGNGGLVSHDVPELYDKLERLFVAG